VDGEDGKGKRKKVSTYKEYLQRKREKKRERREKLLVKKRQRRGEHEKVFIFIFLKPPKKAENGTILSDFRYFSTFYCEKIKFSPKKLLKMRRRARKGFVFIFRKRKFLQEKDEKMSD
jgi:hypothetical protein